MTAVYCVISTDGIDNAIEGIFSTRKRAKFCQEQLNAREDPPMAVTIVRYVVDKWEERCG